jgi:diguanylate cyclase (GGDEF)-like protein
MVLLVAAYFALPVARTGLVGAIGLLAVAAIEYGVFRTRTQRAGAWHLLAAAVALLAVGDVVFVALDVRTPNPVPYPSLPDVFYIAAYLPLTVALLWLGRPLVRHQDETSLIDVISVTLAGSLVIWILLVRPELEAQGLGVAARIAAVAAWVGYIAVFAASVRVLLYWRRNVAVLLLGIAIFSFLVSEIFYGRELVRGTWTAGSLVDFGYFVFTALCGAAALEPSMRDIASRAHARHALGPGRLGTIALALLVGPTALLVEASMRAVTTGFAIAIVSGFVSVLMLIRLAMTGRAYQRRAAREHAVRVASQAMVSALTPKDVVEGARRALREVVLEDGEIDVELRDPYPPDAPRDTVERTGPGRQGELAVPLTGSAAALVFDGPVAELAELTDLLRSLADQAALSMQRISLAQVAGAEERERYFRTLVLTSTDVIIISRGDRIEYATPSSEYMFGRDVCGERFDDIVTPSPPPGGPTWPATVDRAEGTICGPKGELTVLVQRRDLTGDPTVRGVVTTMRDVTAERNLQRDLAYRAGHDELTGLANVRAWGETLAGEVDRRRGPGNGVGVVFIDLDNFKSINDRFGHPVGDGVLAEVARRIQGCLRSGDLAARVGGDEFAALMRGLSSVEDARAVAQRLADALARPAQVDSVTVECQASIGLAYTEGTEEVHTLVRQADTALYAAKDQGKGRWTEYNPKQWAPARATHNGTPHAGTPSAVGG